MEKSESVYLGRFYINTSKAGATYIKGRLGAATMLGFEKTLPDGTRVYDIKLVNEPKKEDGRTSSADRPPVGAGDIGETIPF